MRIINSLLAILAFFTTVQLKSQATLEFEEAEYDFGIIPYNIPATAHIKVTNTGDEPLVINKVTTSCGCAIAAWDDTPVQPGKQTSVAVTYDAKTMGHFYKTVSIYCNAEPYIFDYDLIGEVSKENADYERLYPIDMGDIRADNNELIFDNVHTGETYETSFYVVNLGEEPYTPVLMLVPECLYYKAEPETIGRKEISKVTVTLDASKLTDMGLTQRNIYLARFMGDKICDDTQFDFSAFVIPNVTAENENAPAIALSETQWRPPYEEGKKKYTHKFKIRNEGRSPLEIESLQVFNYAVTVNLKNRTIAPGKETTLKVTVYPKHLTKNHNPKILLITNDPKNPKTQIKVIRK